MNISNIVNLDTLMKQGLIDQVTHSQLITLTQSESNLLIVGVDKELNLTLLKALYEAKRYKMAPSVVIKEDTDIDFRTMYPNDQIISLTEFQSVLEARKFLHEMVPDTQLVITDIQSHITSELYTLCCEGLRSNVLATHTCVGSLNAVVESIALLNQKENINLPYQLVVERVKRLLNIIIECNQDEGITIHQHEIN